MFSVSVHIFFVLINRVIIAGICLLDILENKRFIRNLVVLADYAIVVVIMVGLLGGFSSGMAAQHDGLGIYSFNLNAFFNPQGCSCILAEQPLYGYGQYEGLGYLGIGFIFLLFLCAALFVAQDNLLGVIKSNYKMMIALAFIFLCSLIVALSPVITCGDHLLIEMKLPQFIIDVWSIFRSSGRAIWACIYIIEICIFLVLTRNAPSSRFVTAALTAALFLQIYDVHEALAQRYERYSNEVKYDSILRTESFWNELGRDDGIQHLVYYSLPEPAVYYSLSNG